MRSGSLSRGVPYSRHSIDIVLAATNQTRSTFGTGDVPEESEPPPVGLEQVELAQPALLFGVHSGPEGREATRRRLSQAT